METKAETIAPLTGLAFDVETSRLGLRSGGSFAIRRLAEVTAVRLSSIEFLQSDSFCSTSWSAPCACWPSPRRSSCNTASSQAEWWSLHQQVVVERPLEPEGGIRERVGRRRAQTNLPKDRGTRVSACPRHQLEILRIPSREESPHWYCFVQPAIRRHAGPACGQIGFARLAGSAAPRSWRSKTLPANPDLNPDNCALCKFPGVSEKNTDAVSVDNHDVGKRPQSVFNRSVVPGFCLKISEPRSAKPPLVLLSLSLDQTPSRHSCASAGKLARFSLIPRWMLMRFCHLIRRVGGQVLACIDGFVAFDVGSEWVISGWVGRGSVFRATRRMLWLKDLRVLVIEDSDRRELTSFTQNAKTSTGFKTAHEQVDTALDNALASTSSGAIMICTIILHTQRAQL